MSRCNVEVAQKGRARLGEGKRGRTEGEKMKVVNGEVEMSVGEK